MSTKPLDVVVLTREVPAEGLRPGDRRAVVDLREGDAYVVEFVAASGRTRSLVTLSSADIREVDDDGPVAVRPTTAKAP